MIVLINQNGIINQLSILKDVINIFKNILLANMNDVDIYKDSIPQFVIKLHHILQRNEFKDFITWANDGTEILIKNAKKLEDKVLPYFFRHKHLSSFIRQLNMYKFNKVNKISKERCHMYFKNDHFKRNEFEQMKLIKRTQRSKKNQDQVRDPSVKNQPQSQIMKQGSIDSELTSFKNQSQTKFAQVQEILIRILRKHPALKQQINPALKICQNMKGDSACLLGVQMSSLHNIFAQDQNEEFNKNMLGTTVREFPPAMQSMIYPSICSLANLDV